MAATAPLEVLDESMMRDMTKLAMTCVTLFLAFHIWAFGGGVRLMLSPLQHCRQLFDTRETSAEQRKKDARVEREFQEVSANLWVHATAIVFHLQFLVILWCLMEFCTNPGMSRAVQLLSSLSPYVLHGCVAHRKFSFTTRNCRIFKSLYFLGFNCFILGQSLDEQGTNDPVAQQIFQVASRFIMTVLFMDTSLMLPWQVITSLCECYSYWKFKGEFLAVTSFMCGQGLLLASLMIISAAMEFTLRRYILARLESADAGSMVSGFRKVLRGICDGEVLLDHDLRIDSESPCLQHILMSHQSLMGKAFPEMLDEEERPRFRDFIKSSTEAASAAPDGKDEDSLAARPCFRVSLRGACNIRVGVDVFHVPVVDQTREETLHLLALREDSESRHLPEAADMDISNDWLDQLRQQQAVDLTPQRATRRAASRASGSSAGYLLPACPELAELTLLVDMATPMVDVVQAHLRYKRISDDDAANMPSMRGLILPTEWETVRGKMERFVRKMEEGEVHKPKGIHGLRLKTPNDPRKYMIARNARLLPGQDGGQPSTGGKLSKLWIHLSNFIEESSRVRPPPELLGILEGRRPGQMAEVQAAA